MKKEIKNPRALTIEFRPEVANALRDLCSKTGITLTRAVNNAVEAYMPVIQKLAEALNDASVTSESPANISTNVCLDLAANAREHKVVTLRKWIETYTYNFGSKFVKPN